MLRDLRSRCALQRDTAKLARDGAAGRGPALERRLHSPAAVTQDLDDFHIDEALLRRLDVPGPRYTSYPTVPVWSDSFGPADHARALAAAGAPLSIYVHIPFCASLCSYCGCNVVVTRDPARVDRYLAALLGEIDAVADRLDRRRRVTRVHLGGGTPTFLDEPRLAALWSALVSRFEIARDAEIAVEVNPTGTRASQLELLADLGFNRLSMGVQDFDPAVQAAIGRRQSIAETRATLDAARAAGFRSVNFDLIYGLPRQTEESFRRTAAEVVALAPERVAIFSFAYVPSVKPAQRRLPMAEAPSPMQKLSLFRAARQVLMGAGYRAIGMDHFALPGDELARAAERGALGRDFQGYTVERAPETVGLGATAISSAGGAYAQNAKSLGAYESALGRGRLPTERGIWLGDEDRERREIIQQIMCNLEVELDEARFSAELRALEPLAADGLVTREGRRLRVTPLGRLFVRNVAMVFDAHLGGEGARLFSRAV
jgi:oxygen-independent coproporphyrinogen III oxidase